MKDLQDKFTMDWIHTYTERDYPEDSHDENGNYFCECVYCRKTFIGHKRRAVCKECSKREELK